MLRSLTPRLLPQTLPDPERPGTERGAGSALCAYKGEETKPREVRQPATVAQQSWPPQAWAGSFRPLSTAGAGWGSRLQQLHLRTSHQQLMTLHVSSEVASRVPSHLFLELWGRGGVAGSWHGGSNEAGADRPLKHPVAQISLCVGRTSRAPGEEGLEGLPSAWGGGISWGLCSGPGALQEGQLHQTHAWLKRGVWPSLSAGSTHLPWDLEVSAPPPPRHGSDPGAVLVSRRQ